MAFLLNPSYSGKVSTLDEALEVLSAAELVYRDMENIISHGAVITADAGWWMDALGQALRVQPYDEE